MFIYEIIDGNLRSFKPQKQQLRRQAMPPVYAHNGALYVAKISTLLREKSFNLPETHAYLTEGVINVDIDTPDDWSYAEFLVGRESNL
jgi:CMP-N-acetylneuraminic acid synthetase